MNTNPIQQARANGIKINQPNTKEELEEIIKIVTEENKKAALVARGETAKMLIRVGRLEQEQSK